MNLRRWIFGMVCSLILMKGSVHADVTETATLPLGPGLTAASIDAANGFAFFVSTAGPGVPGFTGTLTRIRLSDFTTALSDLGFSPLLATAMDPQGQFVYAGSADGTLYKIPAAIVPPPAISSRTFTGAIGTLLDDPAHGYIFTGMLNAPATALQISSDTALTSLANVTLGFSSATVSAIDLTNGFAYYASSTTVPGVITRVALSGFTLSTSLTFPASTGAVGALVVDTTTGDGYAGTTDTPAKIVKFHLSNMSITGTISLIAGENDITTGVIDPASRFAYFGTSTSPGKVVRIALGGFTESAPTLTLPSGENNLIASVLDYGNQFAYFGTGGNPGLVIKTDLIGGVPAITQQPKSQSITAGGNTSFVVSAVGRGLTYQWQRNGVAIAGATAPTYVYGPATIVDDGVSIACVVSNLVGSVTSAGATLTVVPVVRVYPNPWRADRHAGEMITFDGLPTNCTVKIFTMSAHWVKDLPTSTGSVTWDRTNDAGQTVASGYYLYLVKSANDNQTVHGKFAIIK